MADVTIPHNYTPRDYQLPVLRALDGGYRYIMLMWARRHGKDKTVFCYIVKRMMQEVGNYGYVFPTSSLAREAAWQNLDKTGFRLLDHIPARLIKRRVDNQMVIELVNGSTLKFFGSDRQISVGTAYKGLVFSEFALQDPHAYYYLRPVVNENKGFIILISTPRGKNHFFDLWNVAQAYPETWFTQKVTWKDAGVFTPEDIEGERQAGMSDEMIDSEYNCEFSGLEGSYYIRYVDKMRLEGRITHVGYDSMARVCTAWDLGINDSTTIIFYQLIGQEIHVIDSYEHSGVGLDHYAQVIQSKGYVYDTHYAPHDIENRELGTGISRKEVASGLGIDFVTLPTLRVKVIDGIEIARGMFSRIWMDEVNNKQLIISLENYRKEFDNKHKIFTNYPVHDSHSHYCDAWRYMSIACKIYGAGSDGMGVDDIYRLNARNRYMRG